MLQQCRPLGCCRWHWQWVERLDGEVTEKNIFSSWPYTSKSKPERDQILVSRALWPHQHQSRPARTWPLPWVRLAWLPWFKLWTSPHAQSCVALTRLLLEMIPAFCYLLSTLWVTVVDADKRKLKENSANRKLNSHAQSGALDFLLR